MLETALALLDQITEKWLEESIEADLAKPLWRDPLEAVLPEWAKVASRVIGWLDQVPASLIAASEDMSASGSMSGYATLGKELDALLTQVSPSQSWTSRLSLSGGPALAEKLRLLVNKKKDLDLKSAAHIRKIRAATEMGEMSRQAAGLLSDALPSLSEHLGLRMAAINLAAAPSMYEAQRQAREMKALKRAQESLDLVGQRLALELSPGAQSSQEKLAQMVHEEERMHARLDAVISSIGRKLAGESLGQQASSRTHQVSKVSPESRPEAPGQSGALEKVKEPRRGLLSFWSPKPTREKTLPRNIQKMLGEIDHWGNYKGSSPSTASALAWSNITKLIKQLDEQDIDAWTMLPKSKKPLLSVLTQERFWEPTPRFESQIENLVKLIDKAPPDETSGFDAAAILRAARHGLLDGVGNREYAWRLLSHGVKMGGCLENADLDMHRVLLSAHDPLKALLEGQGVSKAWRDALVNVFAKGISIETLDKELENMTFMIAPLLTVVADLPPAKCSRVCLHALVYVFGYGGDLNEKQFDSLARMSSGDKELLTKFLIASPKPHKMEWLEMLDGSRLVRDELQYPSKEGQWARALHGYVEMRRGRAKAISTDLVQHAIDTGSLPLLNEIMSHMPDAKMASSPKSWGADMLRDIMEIDLSSAYGKSRTRPSYWCRIFQDQIDEKRVIREQGDESRPAPSMTPLMRACQKDAEDWVQALVKAGADPWVRDKGFSAVELWRNEVFGKVLASGSPTHETFVRNMVRRMDQAGLWDIGAAVVDGVHRNEIIAEAMIIDSYPGLSSDQGARKNAIRTAVSMMNLVEFKELIAVMLRPDRWAQPSEEALKGALVYGAECDLFTRSESDMKRVLEDAKMRAQSPNEFSKRDMRQEEPRRILSKRLIKF